MPTNFRIQVPYKDKTYEVNVTRTSTGVSPNAYFASIVVREDITNKYPATTYTTVDGELLFEDNLDKLLPGFAEIQKVELKGYLDLNCIEL